MGLLQIGLGIISSDKCYTLSGTITNFDTNLTFILYNASQTESQIIGTATGNGVFSFDFTPDPDIEFVLLEWDDTEAALGSDFGIFIREECLSNYCSECLNSVDDLECLDGHLVIHYYNDENAFGLNYSTMQLAPTLIIEGGLFPSDTVNNDESLFNSSDGRKFLHYVNQRKTMQIITRVMPEYMHDALALALEHDHFFINGVEYVKAESDYVPNWKDESLLAQVIVEVEPKIQDKFNRYC